MLLPEISRQGAIYQFNSPTQYIDASWLWLPKKNLNHQEDGRVDAFIRSRQYKIQGIETQTNVNSNSQYIHFP